MYLKRNWDPQLFLRTLLVTQPRCAARRWDDEVLLGTEQRDEWQSDELGCLRIIRTRTGDRKSVDQRDSELLDLVPMGLHFIDARNNWSPFHPPDIHRSESLSRLWLPYRMPTIGNFHLASDGMCLAVATSRQDLLGRLPHVPDCWRDPQSRTSWSPLQLRPLLKHMAISQPIHYGLLLCK